MHIRFGSRMGLEGNIRVRPTISIEWMMYGSTDMKTQLRFLADFWADVDRYPKQKGVL